MTRRTTLAAAAAALLLAQPGVARAEDAPSEDTALAPVSPVEVVVRGQPRTDRGTVVTVLPEEELERLGATSVGETLERLPAFNSGGGRRGERILTLRGFDQRQLAVFVDGVPVYVPYDGQLDLSKLPIDMVERLSVVKGSGTLLYGPNGLGGAVNITTREPTERPSLRLRSEVAPWSALRGSAVGSAALGPVAAIAGVGAERVRYVRLSDDFSALPNQPEGRRLNSDRRELTLATKWTWDLSETHRLRFSASCFGGTFGVPPGTRDLTVRYWRWTDWESGSLGLSHAYRGARLQTEAVVYVSRFTNTLDSYDDASYTTQRLPKAFHTIYDDTSMGAFARTANLIPLDTGRALRVRTWSGIKHDTHSSFDSPGTGTTEVSTNLLTTSAEVEADLVAPWLRASAGVEIDGELPDTPPSGPKPRAAAAVGPLASVTVTPTRAVSVTLSASSRTRFPTLRERFSTVFGAREPNPRLQPEHAWNFSLDGVFKPSRALRVAVGLFDSELDDLITSVLVRPQTDQLQNLGRARYLGGEAEVTWSPREWLDLTTGWVVMSARAGDALDQPIAYRPVDKGLVAVTVRPWPSVSLTGVMRRVGAQDFQDQDTGRWGTLGGYQLFDARAEWQFHPLMQTWVRASNLADTNVESRYSFPEAGRTIFAGLGSRLGS